MTYREYTFRSADDRLNLFARDYPEAAHDGGCIPLLMMHGLTRNSADFEPLIVRLETGRRMMVPDQRGRGRSDYDPDAANYRPEIYVADMWKLLDDLDIDQVICIGTSMGGLMAMVMAAMAPDRIAGIVLNDVGPEVSEDGLDRIRGYVGPAEPMADWDEAAERCRAVNEAAMVGFGREDWLAFARRTCEEFPGGQVRFAYDPAIAHGLAPQDPATIPPDLWALWRALSEIPILVLRGALSDILTRDTVSQMAAQHPGEFHSAEVPGRGHAPILDEQVAIEAVGNFLERLP